MPLGPLTPGVLELDPLAGPVTETFVTVTGSPILLGADVAAAATTLQIAGVTGYTPIRTGSFISVSAGLATNEIRRVTAIDGLGNATVATAFKYAHTAGENVWPVHGAVPLGWYGVKFGDSTVDSYRPLQNALCDQNIHKLPFVGCGGDGGVSTYSSRPFWRTDKARVWQTQVTAQSSFGIDPVLTLWNGEPVQHFYGLAGQFGTATFNATTNQVTFSTSPGGLGQDVTFYAREGATIPGGLEEGRMYFVNEASGARTLTLDRFSGSTVDITSNGSGEIAFFSTGGARLADLDVKIVNSSGARGLSGLLAVLIQPSYSDHLRIEGFYSNATLCGQQGTFRNFESLNGYIGCRCAGLQFGYFEDCNFELNDFLFQLWPYDWSNETNTPKSPCNKSIKINGVHFENSANGFNLIQTVKGNASVSAGTFTLTFNGQTTSAISYNATAATIQAALEALSSIGSGNAACTDEAGGLPAGRCRITFQGTLGYKSTNSVTINTSGLTGGVYTINVFNPNGKVVDHQAGSAINCHTAYLGQNPALPNGVGADFWNFSGGTDEKSSFKIENATSSGSTVSNFVVNSASGQTLTWNEIGGYGSYEHTAVDDTLTDTQVWTISGLNGRRVVFRNGNVGGDTNPTWLFKGSATAQSQPQVRIEKGASGQTGNLLEVTDEAGAKYWRSGKNGYIYIGKTAAPTAADVSASELTMWLDATPGATKAMFYAKDSGGTARTGSVNLT